MFIEKTCAEEFLAYIDKNVNIFLLLKKPQTFKIKKGRSAKNKCPWTAELVFMAQSPTIFNFLPAGNHIAITELAEKIACQRFSCCRECLVWELRFPVSPHASWAGQGTHVLLSCLFCCQRGNLCKRWNTQLEEQPQEPS